MEEDDDEVIEAEKSSSGIYASAGSHLCRKYPLRGSTSWCRLLFYPV